MSSDFLFLNSLLKPLCQAPLLWLITPSLVASHLWLFFPCQAGTSPLPPSAPKSAPVTILSPDFGYSATLCPGWSYTIPKYQWRKKKKKTKYQWLLSLSLNQSSSLELQSRAVQEDCYVNHNCDTLKRRPGLPWWCSVKESTRQHRGRETTHELSRVTLKTVLLLA